MGEFEDLIKKTLALQMPEDWEEKAKARWGRSNDPTCLSYWFPKIKAADIPTPKTILVEMPYEAHKDIYNLFDGNPMTGEAEPFFQTIKNATDRIGYPCFLRTGQTSNKHSWEKTCYLKGPEGIRSHVIALVEFSSIADMCGLDCSIWVVRELLPIKPFGKCPRYGNMPINKEFRVFVDNGQIRCWHPYWPKYALERGGVTIGKNPGDNSEYLTEEDYTSLCSPEGNYAFLEIASKAGKVLGGAWSVDILETSKGWYLTDMAEAHKSFHWEGCEVLAKETRREEK